MAMARGAFASVEFFGASLGRTMASSSAVGSWFEHVEMAPRDPILVRGRKGMRMQAHENTSDM